MSKPNDAPLQERPESAAERAARTSVLLTATIEQFGTRTVLRHRVRDINKDGARVDQGQALNPGATVVVTVGALEAVAATVIWVANGFAGLKFAKPIDPDQARAKAVVHPAGAGQGERKTFLAKDRSPTAGWIDQLRNPYHSKGTER